MNNSNLYLKIESLRHENLYKSVEAILVIVAMLFVTALLPSLIFQFFFADAALLEQPKVLEYLPAITFGIGMLYALYVFFGNLARSGQIRRMEKELETMDCCGGLCSENELDALEKTIAEAAMTAAEKKSSKKTAKKTSKKTSRKNSKTSKK